MFPHFHKTQLREALAASVGGGSSSRDLDFTASVLRLEAAILERDKVSYLGLSFVGLIFFHTLIVECFWTNPTTNLQKM